MAASHEVPTDQIENTAVFEEMGHSALDGNVAMVKRAPAEEISGVPVDPRVRMARGAGLVIPSPTNHDPMSIPRRYRAFGG